jgi:hypothetical protein
VFLHCPNTSSRADIKHFLDILANWCEEELIVENESIHVMPGKYERRFGITNQSCLLPNIPLFICSVIIRTPRLREKQSLASGRNMRTNTPCSCTVGTFVPEAHDSCECCPLWMSLRNSSYEHTVNDLNMELGIHGVPVAKGGIGIVDL